MSERDDKSRKRERKRARETTSERDHECARGRVRDSNPTKWGEDDRVSERDREGEKEKNTSSKE